MAETNEPMAETKMSSETGLVVAQLLALLGKEQAHAGLERVVQDFPVADRGTVPAGAAHSAWQLIEHIRIAQRDILEFCEPPAGGYRTLQWPRDYWPADAQPAVGAWEATIASLVEDRQALERMLLRPGVDLYTAFPWGDGQNLLREILLVADHNAYHLGELVLLRRLLGNWE